MYTRYHSEHRSENVLPQTHARLYKLHTDIVTPLRLRPAPKDGQSTTTDEPTVRDSKTGDAVIVNKCSNDANTRRINIITIQHDKSLDTKDDCTDIERVEDLTEQNAENKYFNHQEKDDRQEKDNVKSIPEETAIGELYFASFYWLGISISEIRL